MPPTLTYPGVYIEEVPSQVRTITGVATSITAFVGSAPRGPIDSDAESPVRLTSYADYERHFGGLDNDSPMSFSVFQYFNNGGSDALVVRVHNDAEPAHALLENGWRFEAASPGNWGDALRLHIDHDIPHEISAGATPDTLFNLHVEDTATDQVESFLNLSSEPSHPRFVTSVVERQSRLLRIGRAGGGRPSTTVLAPLFQDDSTSTRLTGGAEGKRAHTGTPGAEQFLAAHPGAGGNQLRIHINHRVQDDGSDSLFNLYVMDMESGAVERFPGVSFTSGHERNVGDMLNTSTLLRVGTLTERPAANAIPAELGGPVAPADVFTPANSTALAGGSNGNAITAAQISGGSLRAGKRGLYALEKTDLFNLLVLPPLSDAPGGGADIDNATWSDAITYATERRALVLVDPPFHTSGWDAINDLTPASITGVAGRSANAALFFPRIRAVNPLRENRLQAFAPAGAVAGVMARTDGTRGVWKAAAGIDATLNGVPALELPMTDRENGLVNPLGVNCLRSFPNTGAIVWGARTLRGADALASEWKYIPVRRTALFIEESLYRGTQWVVFEPNDEPLWAQIRLNVGAFMQNLFRQGAFQGRSPREAYFVRCDATTTTQADIDLGIVNILVGFAPLKPAEFVVIRLQQIAGELAV